MPTTLHSEDAPPAAAPVASETTDVERAAPSAATSVMPVRAVTPAAAARSGDQMLRVGGGGLVASARDGVVIASEADSLVLTAATEIVLAVGRSTLTLRADGTILLDGQRMTLNAPVRLDLNPDAVPADAPEERRPPCPCCGGTARDGAGAA